MKTQKVRITGIYRGKIESVRVSRVLADAKTFFLLQQTGSQKLTGADFMKNAWDKYGVSGRSVRLYLEDLYRTERVVLPAEGLSVQKTTIK